MPDDWRMGTLSEICDYSKDKVDIDDLTLDTYYSTENMQPNRQGAVSTDVPMNIVVPGESVTRTTLLPSCNSLSPLSPKCKPKRYYRDAHARTLS